ncbi:uncharacterized protein LOC106096083 isoform X1 [Stomoxys calcitrans]|uniref:uncharacterized protein LOC106096083 isoform X1 n=1 Tax=Stomoxys calcitrans TaxID=35570 RepID=UPI0027E3153D|nr:uncharacterized protein LOC106096083 isoform X1 [Stomoxys calcitrans]XP_059218643.1 uncharacterized protein LOC106096083 isoform X1 [Stomoxys calcitrans]XP_059218644.1 uncharacterized protein LOC106096083 isoform X1 [Stomoxys calcitrans]XP_059218645.1 uncharacterized protein LOC106096083 isoform X1 [Stomoxys calcitrans]
MLNIDHIYAGGTCERVSTTPMDIGDEHFNNAGKAADASKATKNHHSDNNDNLKDLSQHENATIHKCDNSLIYNYPPNQSSPDETPENVPASVEDDADDEENEDVITDSEEQLADADCGLSRLYVSEVEIDRREEEETITELVNATNEEKLMQEEQNKSMRVAFGVILRLIFPLANGVVRGIKGIRDVRFLKVLRSIASSRQSLSNLFAFAANTISMNLSSVQVSHRLEPILKLLKIRKSGDGIESLPDVSNSTPSSPDISSPPTTPEGTPQSPLFSPFLREPRASLSNFQSKNKTVPFEEQLAPKCCTINILAEPPPGQPIRADIVLIHGLHGSLVNTWKQGLWENERKPVEFDRPPKPPVRPPKRPRHSRTALAHPPHKQKRARFIHPEQKQHSNEEADEFEDAEYSFICGEPNDVQDCEGIEYSFPTFRLRMNDNGRLMQAEIDSMLNEDEKSPTHAEDKENQDNNNDSTKKNTKPPKPSPNDPNYSKCWPGDWLPIDCPGVRVIAVNYTTDQYLWRPLWKKKQTRSNLTQRAREMAELLIEKRVGYGHPIVWVGHSKGGLFIKQIIVDAWESGRPAAAPFWRAARGVFFYSVPHRGSHLASIKAPFLARSVELIDIEKNSKYLLDLHRRFVGLYHLGHLKIEVFSFVETALTLMSVLYLRIVGVDSADPGIGDVCGIRLDHREICKPRNRDCILYKQLVNMINKVC